MITPSPFLVCDLSKWQSTHLSHIHHSASHLAIATSRQGAGNGPTLASTPFPQSRRVSQSSWTLPATPLILIARNRCGQSRVRRARGRRGPVRPLGDQRDQLLAPASRALRVPAAHWRRKLHFHRGNNLRSDFRGSTPFRARGAPAPLWPPASPAPPRRPLRAF